MSKMTWDMISDRDRAIYHMFIPGVRHYQEIADKVGLTSSRIRMIIHRVLRMRRKEYLGDLVRAGDKWIEITDGRWDRPNFSSRLLPEQIGLPSSIWYPPHE